MIVCINQTHRHVLFAFPALTTASWLSPEVHVWGVCVEFMVDTHGLASPLQVKQQHSKVALQATHNVSHLIFLLLSIAKPSGCVNPPCRNEVITGSGLGVMHYA